MYFIIVVIFLTLFFWLGKLVLKPTTKGMKLLLIVSGISVLFIASLGVFSRHYKGINPLALILILMIGFVLVILYNIRRLR